LEDLSADQKKAIAIAFWNTYGFALRSYPHKKNLWDLIDHHFPLKDLGLKDVQALDQAALLALRDGKDDTDEALRDMASFLPNESKGNVETEPLDAVPSQRRIWWAILEGLKSNEPILLTGSHAAGKTSMVFGLFHLLKKPLFHFTLDEGKSLEDMVGTN